MKMHIERQAERGSFRLILVLILAMGACFWIGGQGTYTALKNRHPTSLACSDLAKGKPTAHWLVLTNCELHVLNSAYMIRRSKYEANGAGRITEAYVPVHVPGQSGDARCYAVMATSDTAIIGLLEELRQVKDEPAMAAFVTKHAAELQVRRDVQGLVRFGATEHSGEHSKLAGLRDNLAPDYIIVAEGEKPSLSTSAGLLLLGFAIGGGLFMLVRSKREETTDQLS